MAKEKQIDIMVTQLQHLMGSQDNETNFTMPSFLKDVPSYTTTTTAPDEKGEELATLRRYTD